ncbi:flavin reductase family protein [Chitinimonas sp.]|uniref:flavin reductase family protein n=1 Tax=Chitinimonas sp. TaxID=1934313 RepID=UPI0035AF1E26
MRLLPTPVVNRVLPLLKPVRAAVQAGWLREDVIDYYGRLLHPQLQLQRTLARVAGIRAVSESTIAISLLPSKNWQGMQPGQHIGVTVEFAGVRHQRRYSPCQSAGQPLEIAVKRHADGVVSPWLHTDLQVGSYVELSAAQGEFVLPATLPAQLLFLAAGSGITPVLALLRELSSRNYQGEVALCYYGRHRRDMAYLDTLQAMQIGGKPLRLLVGLTGEAAGPNELTGRISTTHLEQALPALRDSHAFACGSHGFTEAAKQAWHAIGGGKFTEESFTPPQWQLHDDEAMQLTYARSGISLSGRTGKTLLEQAEAHGLKPASGCRMGICHTCTCQKRSGAVRDLRTGLISTEPDEAIRLCISAPVGDVTLDL